MNIVDRFLSYVSFDTQSSERSTTSPSTRGQLVFAECLRGELLAAGLRDVELDEWGHLYATLPANTSGDIPAVGFIAHLDTSPDAPGGGVKPRVVRQYDGGDIVLESGLVTSPAQFPELLAHRGEDLIVTDGRTLLGADDKAGVAEIVQAMAYLRDHPEIPHGAIRVAFTPDEEVGRGTEHFDVEKFGCAFAYTIDGGEVGEIEYENFNAASATVTITGRSVHPGYARGKMVNAARVAAELAAMMPAAETPETTSGREGFFHLTGMSGSCGRATLSLIIRDFDRAGFERRKRRLTEAVGAINGKYGEGVAALDIRDQYYNMYERIEPVMRVVDIAKEAIRAAGVEPRVRATRGGTDGAMLSFRGLPCPNIFAGGLNFHGPHELCPVPSLAKAMMTIVNICAITAKTT